MTAINELIEYCKSSDLQALLNTSNSPMCHGLNVLIEKVESEYRTCPFCSGAIKPCTGEFVNALLVNALKYLTREQFNALTAALYYRSDFQKEREAELLEKFKFNSALVLKFKNTLVLENVQGDINKRLNEGKG